MLLWYLSILSKSIVLLYLNKYNIKLIEIYLISFLLKFILDKNCFNI